jgi:hypothetical protein
MKTVDKSTSTVWLQTDNPVSTMNGAMWRYLPALEHALRRGITAVRDPKRPEFYELEVGEIWYYLHFPTRIPGIFLIAASRSCPQYACAEMAHGCAV